MSEDTPRPRVQQSAPVRAITYTGPDKDAPADPETDPHAAAPAAESPAAEEPRGKARKPATKE